MHQPALGRRKSTFAFSLHECRDREDSLGFAGEMDGQPGRLATDRNAGMRSPAIAAYGWLLESLVVGIVPGVSMPFFSWRGRI